MGAKGIFNRKCTVDPVLKCTISENIIKQRKTGILKPSKSENSFQFTIDNFKSSDIPFSKWFEGTNDWMADHESSLIFWHLIRKQHVIA